MPASPISGMESTRPVEKKDTLAFRGSQASIPDGLLFGWGDPKYYNGIREPGEM